MKKICMKNQVPLGDNNQQVRNTLPLILGSLWQMFHRANYCTSDIKWLWCWTVEWWNRTGNEFTKVTWCLVAPWERQLEANECFLLHGIRVILPLNSSISIGATRYAKICSKIEKLIKQSCWQHVDRLIRFRMIWEMSKIQLRALFSWMVIILPKTNLKIHSYVGYI